MCCKPGSREALEKILVTHAGRINIPGIPLRELTDQLMDWATGQRERGWCEHCSPLPGGWLFQEKGTKTPISASCWKVCPLCAAKRPEDA